MEEDQEEKQASCLPVSVLIAYQYFMQGVCLSLSSTIILTYPTLPTYSVLSIFAATSLPFSFKFLLGTACLTQPPSSNVTPTSITADANPGSSPAASSWVSSSLSSRSSPTNPTNPSWPSSSSY